MRRHKETGRAVLSGDLSNRKWSFRQRLLLGWGWGGAKAFRLGPNDLDEVPRIQAVHCG